MDAQFGAVVPSLASSSQEGTKPVVPGNNASFDGGGVEMGAGASAWQSGRKFVRERIVEHRLFDGSILAVKVLRNRI
jgi:hypothetical protein